MSSLYTSHPLRLSASPEIRVLTFCHNETPNDRSRDPQISCKLHVVALDDTPRYTALSYVWGDASVTKVIDIEGQPFHVRQNLWDFLVQKRSVDAGEYIWIDAICIDQSSIAERNHQVAFMGRIYAQASLTIVWLGLGLEQPIRRIEELYPDGTLIERASKDPTLIPQETKLELDSCFERLSQCDYWTRLWIVQEFVISPNLEIWSGAASMNGDYFTPVSSKARSMMNVEHFGTDIFEDRPGHLHMASLIYRSRNEYHLGHLAPHDPEWLSTTNLIQRFRHSKCSDVRDRVYGLLGLVEWRELSAFPIRVDYSKTPFALLGILVQRRVQQLKQLDVDQPDATPFKNFCVYVGCLIEQLQLREDEKAMDILLGAVAFSMVWEKSPGKTPDIIAQS